MLTKIFMENIFLIFIIIIIFIISYLVINKHNVNFEGYTPDISGNITILDNSNNILVLSLYNLIPYCENYNNSINLKSCKFYFKNSTYSTIFSTIDNRASLIEDNILKALKCFNTDGCNSALYSLDEIDKTYSYIYMPSNVEQKWDPITFQILNYNIDFLKCLQLLVTDCKCVYNLDKDNSNEINILDPILKTTKLIFKKIDFNTILNINNFSFNDVISVKNDSKQVDLSLKYMYCKLTYNGGSYYCILLV